MVFIDLHPRRYMAKILPTRRKTLSNQSINRLTFGGLDLTDQLISSNFEVNNVIVNFSSINHSKSVYFIQKYIAAAFKAC